MSRAAQPDPKASELARLWKALLADWPGWGALAVRRWEQAWLRVVQDLPASWPEAAPRGSVEWARRGRSASR